MRVSILESQPGAASTAQEWDFELPRITVRDTTPSKPDGPVPQMPPTVEHVIEQFKNDRKACGLSPETLKKYRQDTDLLREFCKEKGTSSLRRLVLMRPGDSGNRGPAQGTQNS